MQKKAVQCPRWSGLRFIPVAKYPIARLKNIAQVILRYTEVLED